MSLSARDSERRGRGRSKSPGPRAKSPAARAPSPDPGIYGGQRYEYEYAQPTYSYAPPQAPDAPPAAVPTSPSSSYTQTSTMQFDGAPRYADPGQYQHTQVNAQYADTSQYQRRASSPTMQPYTPQGEYRNAPPQDRTPYAEPSQYQWADLPQSPHGYEHPESPTAAKDRSLSLNASGGFNLNLGGNKPHAGSVSSPTAPQYAQPTPPQYAQPTLPQYAQPQQYGYAQLPAPHTGRPEAMKVHSSGPPPRPSHSPRPPSPSPTTGYANPPQYQYAQPERIQYSYKPPPKPVQYVNEPSSSNLVAVGPGGGGGSALPPPSPGLHASMGRLSVSGGASVSYGHGQAPPASPLLEAYHGTYQSISPMPSPMMLASRPDDDLDDLEPLDGSDDDGRRPGYHRPARRYDPESDAKELVEALRHSKVDPDPLIEILPRLGEKQILELRVEFKKHYKLQGQGVNIAKLIKSKLVPSSFGKACYATALGRWESEAYWANFWFQSNTSRRELLIESLFGRKNAEIHQIKLAFKDRRYNDSLERCMKAELKADKFRTAVLLVLEENRQEEGSPLYMESIREDARRLHDAIIAEKGGETLMIQICVTRSDAQLREILKAYEQTYRKNFARDMLRRSTNLVGETLAHILNGIINAPVRDALLLHQAITESSRQTRDELLISRLVRYHWDRQHLERVKAEFRSRYGKELATTIAENLTGSFGLFMVELCRTR
ncbi:hypothetical protein GP486_005789 [Trichoglossum hirsutum]|uniref:Annexin n=1 Tax=Trichoglossum hirsutum TaxID=265104 RepID=A0A9P8L8K2_9PEZI|nr:hypothetical protein GP486_005789 [Trichoglossum hirsutum]